MGIDARIYARLRDATGEFEFLLPNGYTLQPADPECAPDGATHEIDTLARYYGEGYERGPWPELCAVLMLLHARPDVENVWYGGDGTEDVPECPKARVQELSAHFMSNGCRPYRESFK
jgi:hypothetical protein